MVTGVLIIQMCYKCPQNKITKFIICILTIVIFCQTKGNLLSCSHSTAALEGCTKSINLHVAPHDAIFSYNLCLLVSSIETSPITD